VSDSKDRITTPADAINAGARLTPKTVAALQADPESIRPLARTMMAINLTNMFTHLQTKDVPIRDRLDFHKAVAELGGMQAKDNTGPRMAVTINISRVADENTSVVLEHDATREPHD